MRVIRYLPVLLLAGLAANPALVLGAEPPGKPHATAPRPAQFPEASNSRVIQAQRQQDADEKAHLEKFPPKPGRTLPPGGSGAPASSGLKK